jgi:hypothetical protein
VQRYAEQKRHVISGASDRERAWLVAAMIGCHSASAIEHAADDEKCRVFSDAQTVSFARWRCAR